MSEEIGGAMQDVLFFCLETKEKIPKEKLKAALPELLR